MKIKSVGLHSFILLFVVLLGGCGTSNVKESYTFKEDEKSGLVVFSRAVDFHRTWPPPLLGLRFRSVDRSEKHFVILADGTVHNNEDWKNPVGRLVYLELAEGQYEFYEWLKSIDLPGEGYPLYSLIQFNVEPGQVTYIGNLFFDILEEKRAYKFEISDKSERDLDLLVSRLPNIKKADIKTRLAEAAEEPAK